MRRPQILVTIALSCLATAEQASATPDQIIAQFVDSCIGSLPDFARIAETFQGTGFERTGEGQWLRDADGAVFMVRDAGDRLVCMAGLTGDYTEAFSASIEDRLANSQIGRVEKKQLAGRTLYLLQAPLGLTLLEVIPPMAATTFIVANAQKAAH